MSGFRVRGYVRSRVAVVAIANFSVVLSTMKLNVPLNEQENGLATISLGFSSLEDRLCLLFPLTFLITADSSFWWQECGIGERGCVQCVTKPIKGGRSSFVPVY